MRASTLLIVVAVVLVFGVLAPWYRGWAILDSGMVVVYACISLLFVAPTTAEMFGALETTPASDQVLVKTAGILAYGWGVSVIMLICSIVTVNLTHWQGRVLTPPSALLASALLLGLTLSSATIAGTAILARNLGRGKSKAILRVIFLLLLLTWRFTPPWHLTATQVQQLILIVSGVCAIAAIILLRSEVAQARSVPRRL